MPCAQLRHHIGTLLGCDAATKPNPTFCPFDKSAGKKAGKIPAEGLGNIQEKYRTPAGRPPKKYRTRPGMQEEYRKITGRRPAHKENAGKILEKYRRSPKITRKIPAAGKSKHKGGRAPKAPAPLCGGGRRPPPIFSAAGFFPAIFGLRRYFSSIFPAFSLCAGRRPVIFPYSFGIPGRVRYFSAAGQPVSCIFPVFSQNPPPVFFQHVF